MRKDTAEEHPQKRDASVCSHTEALLFRRLATVLTSIWRTDPSLLPASAILIGSVMGSRMSDNHCRGTQCLTVKRVSGTYYFHDTVTTRTISGDGLVQSWVKPPAEGQNRYHPFLGQLCQQIVEYELNASTQRIVSVRVCQGALQVVGYREQTMQQPLPLLSDLGFRTPFAPLPNPACLGPPQGCALPQACQLFLILSSGFSFFFPAILRCCQQRWGFILSQWKLAIDLPHWYSDRSSVP